MTGPIWISTELALAIHDAQIAEHGGIPGVRDLCLLESALARAPNKQAYGETDLCALAAAYAYGVARNHPFGDGTKRTALVVCELFLDLNNVVLTADDAECVVTFLSLAAGDLEEDALAHWLHANSKSAD